MPLHRTLVFIIPDNNKIIRARANIAIFVIAMLKRKILSFFFPLQVNWAYRQLHPMDCSLPVSAVSAVSAAPTPFTNSRAMPKTSSSSTSSSSASASTTSNNNYHKDSCPKSLHVNFDTDKDELSERKKKYLTAKYGQHQMSLIKKRLRVEMWMYEQLQSLYGTTVRKCYAKNSKNMQQHLPPFLSLFPFGVIHRDIH